MDRAEIYKIKYEKENKTNKICSTYLILKK